MADILVWPEFLLSPLECRAYLNPFTRSGGRTLGGTKPSVRTDLGHWRVDLMGVPMTGVDRRRAWDAIATYLGGTSGRIAVPTWAMDSAPYASGNEEPLVDVPHDDDSLFDDGMPYEQGAIAIRSVGVTGIAATQISMRVIAGAVDLAGVRFSYQHALYQTGRVLSLEGDIVTVQVSPAVRAVIPADADLEFDRPTCVCNLLDDVGMQRSMNADRFERANVSFVEDTQYWAELAAGS
ncbi:hypothetical protein M0654_11265 [Rhizobium sp. NTR19]|uniref:Uncharacterized protein n=1 Tax=Neorhizobium turbinariae TaxID=2937795 RepID=A0ABT0IRT2_9HYPH|nr:hypothetical protein [Neorhizobium turbinariae]MCK8780565.1 hypothetical protein [Neorhizobium turbinariae]